MALDTYDVLTGRNMTKPFYLIACLIFVSLLATAAHAQAPAWHVGTFEMPITPPGCGGVNYCGQAAQTAMDREVLHPKSLKS